VTRARWTPRRAPPTRGPAPDAATIDAPPPADARPPTPDASGPVATITGGAEDGIAAATVTFTYTSSTAGATFECGLDGAFASCSAAGRTFTGLTDGSEHTFRVRAIAGGVTGPGGRAHVHRRRGGSRHRHHGARELGDGRRHGDRHLHRRRAGHAHLQRRLEPARHLRERDGDHARRG
jgi:hypothetical protein